MSNLVQFKKFFSYVLSEYCEETCTVQKDLMEEIVDSKDEESLADLFIEEGFMNWKRDDFSCFEEESSDYNVSPEEEYFENWDLTCIEKYWKSICRVLEIDFDNILELL